MATIVYLDVEDEITSAAARIRGAAESRVALVLPFGSRLATSRINFRLLSREATVNGKRLDVIAPDASARALAASAGLPVFSSLTEYEGALAAPPPADSEPAGAGPSAAGVAGVAAMAAGGAAAAGAAGSGRGAPGTSGGAPGTSGSDLTRTEALPGGGGDPGTAPAGRGRPGGEEPPPTAGSPRVVGPRRGMRPRTAAIAGFGLLALALVVAGVAGWILLPSADITLTPRLETVGPISLTVRADPEATEVDVESAVIPATTITIPLRSSGEFTATGTRVEQTAATGTVTFESINTVGPVAVPEGTRVATLDGVVFQTTERVVVPAAQVAGNQIERGRRNAPIRAVRPGPEGNVPAGAITQVPASLQTQQISVSNGAETTGGAREEFPVVTQADVDGALDQLTQDIAAQFAAALESPVGVPAGATVFPETATLGETRTDVDPATLVGQEVATFTLQMAADGTVQAVDQAPLQEIAEAQLILSVDEGYDLVEGSSVVEVGDATVTEGVITFPVRASAYQVRPVDADALKADVLGLPVGEAEALLEPYGDAQIVLWPDWVTTIPTLEQRVTFVVLEPEGEPLPTPAPDASTEPVPGASGEEPVPSAP